MFGFLPDVLLLLISQLFESKNKRLENIGTCLFLCFGFGSESDGDSFNRLRTGRKEDRGVNPKTFSGQILELDVTWNLRNFLEA